MNFSQIASKFMVHHSTQDYCLCSHDHFIFKYFYKTGNLVKLCQLQPINNSLLARFKDWLARSFIARSLTNNLGIGHVIQLPSGTILALYGKIYRFDGSSKYAKITFNYASKGIASPLKSGVAVHPTSGNAYFGEYVNDSRTVVRIYKIYNDGRNMECCHQFINAEIKHIHGIFWDKYRKRLWISTGDKDTESNLYYTDDEFTTVVKYAGGNQTWRMVSMAITPHKLYWGMDAGKDAPADACNKIMSLDIQSKDLKPLVNIGNPAYHMIRTVSGHIYMGTTYEPGMQQETEHAAALWFSKTGESWEKLKTFPYKASHRKGCTKYAYLFFPTGVSPDDMIMLTPINTVQQEFSMIKYSLN